LAAIKQTKPLLTFAAAAAVDQHVANLHHTDTHTRGQQCLQEDKLGQAVSSAPSNSRSDKEAAGHSAVFQDGCLLVGFNTPGTGGSMDLEGMLTA
jgi:hypothetical protein